MVKILFTANIQRHVACPETEADGATLREVLDNAFKENARARSYGNYPPAFLGCRSGARLLISARPLPGSPISESMSAWIALICSG